MKKTLAILLALAMVLSLAACGSAPAAAPAEEPTAAPAEEPAAPAEEPAAAEVKVYTVGICQLVQHVALDAEPNHFVRTAQKAPCVGK